VAGAVLLDLMQNAQLQWPTKLDDWNAMALEFNQRIEAMGFTPRNGKSLRKKWQVLCSAKQPAEGEELTEQEKRAKAINARGPMGGHTRPAVEGAGDEEARKRVKVDQDAPTNGAAGSASAGSVGAPLLSSPLAPLLPPLPLLQLPLATSDNAALIAEVHTLLASREKAREQQVAMFDEWRRRDEQERQQFERLVQALAARGAPQQQSNAPTQSQPQLTQLNPPQQQQQQQPQHPQQQQQQTNNINGGVTPNI